MWSALGKLNRVLISVGRCTGIAEVNDVVFVKRKIRIVIKSSTHRSFPSLFFTDPADGNTHLCFVFKLPLQKRKRFQWIATTVVTRCGNMAVLCKQKNKTAKCTRLTGLSSILLLSSTAGLSHFPSPPTLTTSSSSSCFASRRKRRWEFRDFLEIDNFRTFVDGWSRTSPAFITAHIQCTTRKILATTTPRIIKGNKTTMTKNNRRNKRTTKSYSLKYMSPNDFLRE